MTDITSKALAIKHFEYRVLILQVLPELFSIVALIGGGGGFLIGTILGIIGGALAISRAR